jgi:hypothetical protein
LHHRRLYHNIAALVWHHCFSRQLYQNLCTLPYQWRLVQQRMLFWQWENWSPAVSHSLTRVPRSYEADSSDRDAGQQIRHFFVEHIQQ